MADYVIAGVQPVRNDAHADWSIFSDLFSSAATLPAEVRDLVGLLRQIGAEIVEVGQESDGAAFVDWRVVDADPDVEPFRSVIGGAPLVEEPLTVAELEELGRVERLL